MDPTNTPISDGSAVVEERTYVLHTGSSLRDYLSTYERLGLPVQLRILEGFLGYFVTEFGTQNQLVHLWTYSDLEDRRRRRALLAKDPQWLECLSIIRPMIATMENRIMYPTRFSPLPDSLRANASTTKR
ncbi:NIPSNAP family protein [Tessaracoccus sp. MC1865]|uniref:NIPSNAP family protein n=1 Tax=Tessaracoccus sp. MC1865 TaxID=2760310 RepID=UPI001601A5C4|nr:NIPSNAP family protein [Tessaracoccus sp. MC1865]MBB1482616.1 NIPSNAP family protein [Tessaracoccus sp. MC1865]QTO37933.1 NIPSNAP family protein [Tessaracoccus sp. MC1865]